MRMQNIPNIVGNIFRIFSVIFILFLFGVTVYEVNYNDPVMDDKKYNKYLSERYSNFGLFSSGTSNMLPDTYQNSILNSLY